MPDHLVLDDTDLAPVPAGPTALKNLTFAQPFTLAVGHGRHVTAAGASSEIDALFTADPGDPVLAANQMIAGLEFIHFENAYESDPRGVVVEPPASWQPSAALLTTLLAEMAGNPVLSPVTLSQFFAQVPQGGNGEPVARHLQAGTPPKSGLIATGMARQLATGRAHLTSLSQAVGGHQHPAVFVELSDLLLAAENRSFDPAQRAAALAVFVQRFGVEVNLVSLAAQKHHHLHVAHRLHPGVGALLGAVSREGRPVVEQRQVRLPRRQRAHARPSTTPPPRCAYRPARSPRATVSPSRSR